jgi:hypothetical protein
MTTPNTISARADLAEHRRGDTHHQYSGARINDEAFDVRAAIRSMRDDVYDPAPEAVKSWVLRLIQACGLIARRWWLESRGTMRER